MSERGSYFELTASAVAGAQGRYVAVEREVQAVEFLPGLAFRPVVGDKLMVNFVRWEPGTTAPLHTHDEEQITFVLEGEFEFDLDGDRRTLRAGDAVVIPPGVPHGARTLDSRCLQVDAFTPPRRALVELLADRT